MKKIQLFALLAVAALLITACQSAASPAGGRRPFRFVCAARAPAPCGRQPRRRERACLRAVRAGARTDAVKIPP